eukprot:357958-Chlamydomonas_euryale.AAC.8
MNARFVFLGGALHDMLTWDCMWHDVVHVIGMCIACTHHGVCMACWLDIARRIVLCIAWGCAWHGGVHDMGTWRCMVVLCMPWGRAWHGGVHDGDVLSGGDHCMGIAWHGGVHGSDVRGVMCVVAGIITGGNHVVQLFFSQSGHADGALFRTGRDCGGMLEFMLAGKASVLGTVH